MELGPSTVTEMARKFGITTPIPPYPSIYIGAADVYPIEMISAYSAFATLGTRAAPNGIVRVENSKGDVLWEPTPVRTPVMSPEEAWLMVSMMKDVVQRGTAAGSVGSQFRIPAGGKTGTTNDGADVWYIGYTSDLVAGVWMGLDKPRKIKNNAQGGLLAAPAWTAFMREVYRRKPASPDWPQPDGIVERQIDLASGQLWAPGCGPAVSDYFLAGTDPIATCVPPASPYGTPGAPGEPGTNPVDTSFGFPAPTTPAPRPDTSTLTHRSSGGTVFSPGAAPVPRASRPRRDSTAGTSAPRDTSNPFTLPPTQRR
jgi:penicillin-binding protein 1A